MENALRLLIHTIRTYEYKPPSYGRSEFSNKCSFDDLIPKLSSDNKFKPKFLRCDPSDAIMSANYSYDYGQEMEVTHTGFHTKLHLSRKLNLGGFCVMVFYQSPDFFLDVSNAETREFMSPQQPVLYYLSPNTEEINIQHRYREKGANTSGTIYPPLLFCHDDFHQFQLVETKLPPPFHYNIPIPDPKYSKHVSLMTSILPVVLTVLLLVKLFFFNDQTQELSNISNSNPPHVNNNMKKKQD